MVSEPVFLHQCINQCRLIEEDTFMESIELIELHGIDVHLDVTGWLDREDLVLLVGMELDAAVQHAVEVGKRKVLDKQFHVRFQLAHSLETPFLIVLYGIGEMDEIVGVVDKIRFEVGG